MIQSRIGYACINTTLAQDKIQVNRSMMKRTFEAKGIPYASALALQNILDLEKVIAWNIENKITLYRMSSDMFPWMSEYELDILPDIQSIKLVLQEIGRKVKQHHHRVTYHPGPFNVLASANEHVVQKTLKELRQHGEIMDMMELQRSPFSKINIHIGGAYGDKKSAMKRFISNVERLDNSARQRLTIENDDKSNMFAVTDLLKVHEETGLPVVFDFLHHCFCTGDLTEEEAFHLAIDTWPQNVRPIVHYSSSKKKFEDHLSMEAAHADYVYSQVNTYNMAVDIMLEAKAKELAVMRYKSQFCNAPLSTQHAMRSI